MLFVKVICENSGKDQRYPAFGILPVGVVMCDRPAGLAFSDLYVALRRQERLAQC